MIIYILFISITVVFTYLSMRLENKRLKQIFFILSILFPAIIAGIRYGVGTDHLGVYKPYFVELVNSEEIFYFSRYEIGYALINIFVAKFLNMGFEIVMFICSLITITFMQLGIRNCQEKINVTVATATFMLLYYQMSFNLVRQLMSIAIIFYAITLLKKSRLKYILLVLIACSFQKTSAIMFFIPIIEPICTLEKFKKAKYALLILSLLIVLNYQVIYSILINIDFISYYISSYLRSTEVNIGIGLFVRVIPFIIPIIFLDKESREDKDFMLFYYLFLIGAVLRLFAYITTTYAERIALYFMISQVFLVGYFVKNVVKYKYPVSICLISFTIFLWYYDFILQNMNQTLPYITIFQ